MVTKDNHGIKQANLLAMLLPIGFSPDKLDSVQLEEFDNFGSARGAVAHGGPGYVRQSVDPKAEYERISKLLPFIEAHDVELDRLLAQSSYNPSRTRPPIGW